MENKTIKICVAMPCNRMIKVKTVLSLLELDIPYEKVFIFAVEGYTISENRTYCVIQAMKNKCTHLLFVDDDMVFPSNTLTQLLSHQKDIVGPSAHCRALPITTHVRFFDHDTRFTTQERMMGIQVPKELFECEANGTAVLLIDMKVFDKIEKPWFSTETYETGMTKMGEDYWFCRQARKAGFTIWCDGTLPVLHIGDFLF